MNGLIEGLRYAGQNRLFLTAFLAIIVLQIIRTFMRTDWGLKVVHDLLKSRLTASDFAKLLNKVLNIAILVSVLTASLVALWLVRVTPPTQPSGPAQGSERQVKQSSTQARSEGQLLGSRPQVKNVAEATQGKTQMQVSGAEQQPSVPMQTQTVQGFRFQIQDCTAAHNFAGSLNVTCNILTTNLDSEPRELVVAGKFGKLSIPEGTGFVRLTPSAVNDNFGDAIDLMVGHVGTVNTQDGTLLPGVPAYIGTVAAGAPVTVTSLSVLQLNCWSPSATPHQFAVAFQNLPIRKQ